MSYGKDDCEIIEGLEKTRIWLGSLLPLDPDSCCEGKRRNDTAEKGTYDVKTNEPLCLIQDIHF